MPKGWCLSVPYIEEVRAPKVVNQTMARRLKRTPSQEGVCVFPSSGLALEMWYFTEQRSHLPLSQPAKLFKRAEFSQQPNWSGIQTPPQQSGWVSTKTRWTYFFLTFLAAHSCTRTYSVRTQVRWLKLIPSWLLSNRPFFTVRKLEDCEA